MELHKDNSPGRPGRRRDPADLSPERPLEHRLEHRLEQRNEPRIEQRLERRRSDGGSAPWPAVERRARPADLERLHRDLQKIVAQFDHRRELEQRRLAHDMHDDLGQLLAAMSMELSVLRSRIAPASPALQQPVHNLQELVDTMIVSVRRILADLPPKMLEDFGLGAALEKLVAGFRERHHIDVRLSKPPGEPPLPDTLCTPLYRMVQEALNNVAKHARATRVSVEIDWNARQLSLAVRDNGTGMAPGSLRKQDSFGLTGMRQRALALGGSFGIDNIPGSGTAICVRIPLRTQGEGA